MLLASELCRAAVKSAALMSVWMRRTTDPVLPAVGEYRQTTTLVRFCACASPTCVPRVELMSDAGAQSQLGVAAAATAVVLPAPAGGLVVGEPSGPQPASTKTAAVAAARERVWSLTSRRIGAAPRGSPPVTGSG